MADTQKTMTVEAAAESIGVELRGDDGQPFCCGERMTVKAGIIGVDYARCRVCGAELLNMLSPHVNGGVYFEELPPEMKGGRIWIGVPPKGNHSERTDT